MPRRRRNLPLVAALCAAFVVLGAIATGPPGDSVAAPRRAVNLAAVSTAPEPQLPDLETWLSEADTFGQSLALAGWNDAVATVVSSTLADWSAAHDAEVAAYAATLQQPVVARVTPTVNAQNTSSSGSSSDRAFLDCTIGHESANSGGYSTETGNGYHGAFQFAQGTWNNAVAQAGYPEWVGRPAGEAPPYVQDAAALWLYHTAGNGPWGGRCG